MVCLHAGALCNVNKAGYRRLWYGLVLSQRTGSGLLSMCKLSAVSASTALSMTRSASALQMFIIRARRPPGFPLPPPPHLPLWCSFYLSVSFCKRLTPRWGAADAEIKVPSGENTELKRFPFKAWSRSVYSRTCYAYCQGFLPCLFLPFRSIHLHFFLKPLPTFSCVSCG